MPDDLAVGQPFRVGVNYWPRRKAMAWWKDFDRAEVADELDVIADLGMSLVRIFLLWEDFQPTSGSRCRPPRSRTSRPSVTSPLSAASAST